MPTLRNAAFAVVAGLVLAGCAGSPGETADTAPQETSAEPAKVTATTGGIQGTVTDEEFVPLAGAEVSIGTDGAIVTNTSTDGTFSFHELEPGTYNLFALKIGYDQATAKADVTVGQVATVQLTLAAVFVGDPFPKQLEFQGLTSQAGFFALPYDEAKAALPDGFEPHPSVVASNFGSAVGPTGEYPIFVFSYDYGYIDGEAIEAGGFALAGLTVDAPEEHDTGGNGRFVMFAHFTSDPAVAKVFRLWNLVPLDLAEIDVQLAEHGPDTNVGTASVASANVTFALSNANAQDQSAVTGGLTSRYYGIVDGEVANYVDTTLTSIFWSVTGESEIQYEGELPFVPLAPRGEGFMVWGESPVQQMTYIGV